MLWMCILASPKSFAQTAPFTFSHLDMDNGLSSNFITSIAQDSSGFIWIGSVNGLQRYDGYQFINYIHSPANPTSLASNIIEQVVVDKFNKIWVLTNLGNIERMKDDGNFQEVLNTKFQSTNSVFSFDENKELYITLYKCVLHYNDQLKKADTLIRITDSSHYKFTCPIVFDRIRNIGWLGGSDNLHYYDFLSSKLSSCSAPESRYHIQIKREFLTSVFLSSSGQLWLTGYAPIAVFRYDPSINKLTTRSRESFINDFNPITKSAVYFNRFFEDAIHNIWAPTEGAGLILFNEQKGDFKSFVFDPQNPQGIRYSNLICSATLLPGGKIWLATDLGISYFNPTTTLFSNVYKTTENKSFPAARVTSFLKSRNGDLWLTTTWGGVVQCDQAYNIKQVYGEFKGQKSFPYALENSFFSLAEDKTGNIWIAGSSGSLSTYSYKTKRFTNFKEHFNGETFEVMKNDTQGNIWIGTSGGYLIKWDEEKKKFIYVDSLLRINHLTRDFSSNAFAIIHDLLIDKDEKIWIANDLHGLLETNTKGSFVNQYFPIDTLIDKTRERSVMCLQKFDNDNLLLGTMSNGLYLFNIRTHTFKGLHPVNGVFKSYITGLSIPINNKVWVASLNGLSCYNIPKKEITNFTGEDGIYNTSFSSLLYQDGNHLLAGNNTGFININTKYDFTRPANYHPFITGLEVSGKVLDIDSFITNRIALHLNYTQNSLTFHFVQPDYVKEHSLVYYYQLEGAEKNWNSTVNILNANYSNLKGGTYTFNVYTEMEDGERGPVTSLRVIIHPPFWQTTLFYLLVLALVGFLIFALFRYRIRVIRKQERMRGESERHEQEMKLTVLRTQLNPHFMFNSLNAIQHFILNNDEEQAIIYLSRFANLMRKILDTSMENEVSLFEELSTLKLYLELENLRLGNSLNITWKISPGLNQLETMVPPLLIQPCIENAIWHGLQYKESGNKWLRISIWEDDKSLFFTVTDNGIGRRRAEEIVKSKSAKKSSKGVLLVQQRVDLLGKDMQSNASLTVTDLQDANGAASGTLAKICIPLIQKTNQYGEAH